MASGIRLGVDVDTRGAASDIRKGLLDPLKDVDKALDQVENASDKLGDTIAEQSRRASRSLKNIDDDGIRPASEGIRNFKEEAVQNFSEVASSFSGDITQMADGVQGLTGGLASALTPGIGIPVAILGAAAGAFLNSWIASSEQSSERVKSMYNDMLESGQTYLSENFIQEEIAKIGEGADDAAGKYEDAMKNANSLGISVQTVLRAMVGDQKAISDVVQATNDKRQAEIGALGTLDKSTQDYADKVDAVNLKADETITKFQQISRDTDTAASKAGAVAAAFGTGNAILDDQIRKVQDLAAKIDGIGNKTIRLDVVPNMAEFERAIGLQQGRTVNVNVNGQLTRIGNQVW